MPDQHERDQFPEAIEVVVEIPSGSRNKYEYDEKTGVIWLNRVLSSAVFYNFDTKKPKKARKSERAAKSD